MDKNEYRDNIVDFIFTSFFSLGIYWFVGRFDLFPRFSGLQVLNIVISDKMVIYFNLILLLLMIICFFKDCSLLMSICIGISPYMIYIFIKLLITNVILQYLMLIFLLLFIVIYIILAIIFKERIRIHLFLKRLCTVLLIVSYIVGSLYLVIPNLRTDNTNDIQYYTLDNYKDVLIKFKEDNWLKLNTDDKEKALNELAVINLYYLLGDEDKEIKVDIKDIDSGSLVGYYTYGDKVISINDNIISNRNKVVSVLMHEVYHRYQQVVIESFDDKMDLNLKIVRDIKEWKDDVNNYIKANDDYNGYYEQSLEKSAREYSDEWSSIYINYIDSL